MLKNYITIAVRNFLRNKTYSFINIFGLAIGISISFVAISYIRFETSFEDFHPLKDRIYRLESDVTHGEASYTSAKVQSVLGDAVLSAVPEVEIISQFRVENLDLLDTGIEKHLIDHQYFVFKDNRPANIFFVKPEFFQVFNFPVTAGETDYTLLQPNNILISESAAKKYFNEQDPVGQSITLNERYELTVAGLLKDFPRNTQIYSDFVVSYSTLEDLQAAEGESSYYENEYIFLLLGKGSVTADVERKINSIASIHLGSDRAAAYTFHLRPLEDIHLSGARASRGELQPIGQPTAILAISVIAGFLLLMAIANFVSLFTARFAERMREVGVRKVLGADPSHIIKQFLGESIIVVGFSSLFGFCFYKFFKHIIQDNLTGIILSDIFTDPALILIFVVFVIIIGIVAGFYPAFYLSRCQPIAVLQTTARIQSPKSQLRKAIVIFQFVLATGFLLATIIVYKQTTLVTDVDYGFQKDNILVLDFQGEFSSRYINIVKNDIINNTTAISVTAMSTPLGRETYISRGFYTDEAFTRENIVMVKLLEVDSDFLSTYGLELTSGSDFTDDYSDGVHNPVLITQSIVDELDNHASAGIRLYDGDEYYEVLGIVKNFHSTPIGPAYDPNVVMRLNPDQCKSLSIRLPDGDVAQSIASIKNIWDRIIPGEPFSYSFVDEIIQRSQDAYRTIEVVFTTLSSLMIIIAFLGIYALVSFTARNRRKEIGIRKVFGASIVDIIALLSREFLLLIGIANLIAWPLGYLFGRSFLQQFPYRISLSVWLFVLTGFVTILVGVAASSYQAFKAANSNPVDVLRYE
ncbi:ABC transporter permease [Candidatus Neomarinimicrobiota bacterium]